MADGWWLLFANMVRYSDQRKNFSLTIMWAGMTSFYLLNLILLVLWSVQPLIGTNATIPAAATKACLLYLHAVAFLY